MMTLKSTDIFFSHTNIVILAFLIAGIGIFFLFKMKDQFSKQILVGFSGFIVFIVAFLTIYVAPASKEVEYLYKELQKTSAIASVLTTIIPGSELADQLNLLINNQIPNNRLSPVPNNHMKILRQEFGTPDHPVFMVSPKQLESYIRITNRCFEGDIKKTLYSMIKTLPVNLGDLQKTLNENYELFLNQNERRPHEDQYCHSKLISGDALMGFY